MNCSGEAVLAIAKFYKIAPEEILVVHDELDFPAGTARIKKGGGHGGHNGIRSLIYSLKSEDFPRLRFGIGRPPSNSGKDLYEYVLEDFTQEESDSLNEKMDEVVAAIRTIVVGSIDEAMNTYNNK